MNNIPNPELDIKITSILHKIDAATPPPPALNRLADTVTEREPQRPNWTTIAAAASIVAVGVGGLALISTRDETSVANQPAPPITSVDGSAASDLNSNPQPLGLGDPFVGAALGSDATPIFEVDRPNWVKQAVYGTNQLPLGEARTTQVVLVGTAGPTYDQPFISLSVFDATGLDLSETDDSIDVGGVAASVTSDETDLITGLTGPTVTLTVPLDGGLALTVNSVRVGVDETVSIAESVQATADSIDLVVPSGFEQLPTSLPEAWKTFSYRWGFDDGTQFPEPVVTTPTSSELVPQQPTIEVIGSNLGPISLASNIGLDVRQNRVVNGVNVALQALPDRPGSYRVDWLDGDWSYYALGAHLASEEELLDLLSSLRLTDAETFATSSAVEVVIPGSRAELAADILGDIDLTADQLEQAGNVSMPTSLYHYQFELYTGLGCSASAAWLDAANANDTAAQSEVLAAVEAATAQPDSSEKNPAQVELEELADHMRNGAATQVTDFGSRDCPLWSN